MSSKEVVSFGTPLINDEDDEFREIWRRVQKSVQGIRRIEDFKFTPDKDLRPADILKILDNSQDNPHKTRKKEHKRFASTFHWTKQVFDRVLECIQNLGEIAAGTASYAVGGPANLCYNALTFVIVVYQSYSGMLASLAHLLGRFVGFFGRLDDYRNTPKLDWKLKRVAMRQLHLFVKICNYTLRLRRSRKFQAKAVMKIFLFKDDGIKSLLQEMEDLEKQESGLVGAAILVIAGQTQVALGDLKEDLMTYLDIKFEDIIAQRAVEQGEQSQETEIRRWKETLIEVLMWPLEDLIIGLDEKVPRCIWESSWQRYTVKEAAKGTGRWLESSGVFRDWIKGENPDTPVLAIEGAEGTGKTQLTANIIARLKDTHGQSAPIAYYFVEPDSKANTASKTGFRAAVTRSLIWQLAESYSPFLQSAANICAKHRTIRDPLEMWKSILVNDKECVNWNITFFIIIDGLVGDDHVKFLREVLSLLKKSSIEDRRIRVLLTGTSDWFSRINKKKNLGLQTIKLGKDNIEEIESYIGQRMDQMDLLQDLSNVNVSEMRQKIVDTLKKVSGGNYRKIDTVLTEISEKDDNLQIDSCLKQAGTAAADQMITIIQTINRRSSPSEISDMNEMVIWVMNGRIRLTPPQLEGALALKDGLSTKPVTNEEQRKLFRSLESRIRAGKYPMFKLTSHEKELVVSFASAANIEDTKQRILEASWKSDDDVSRFHQTEVRMIEHYLRNVCPGDVYDKFGFGDFLFAKLSQTRISLDSENTELTLALRCLQCLVEEPTQRAVLLHPYAADHLYSHLYRAEFAGDSLNGSERNGLLSLTDRHLRTAIGVLLVKLFSKRDAMESLFGIRQPLGGGHQSALAQRRFPSSWEPWIQVDKGLELLKVFFRDPDILKCIKDDDLVTAHKIAYGDTVTTLLETAIKMASSLIHNVDAMPREIEDAFLFLLAANSKKLTSKTFPNSEDSFWNPKIRCITAVESWSSSFVKGKKCASMWKAHKPVILLRFYLNKNKNVTRKDVDQSAREAIHMDDKDFTRKDAEQSTRDIQMNDKTWKASYILVQVTKSKDEAIKLLEKITEHLSAKTSWTGDRTKRRLLAEMYLELGDKFWLSTDSQMQNRAIAAYSESAQMDTSFTQRYLGVISRFTDRMLWKEIASFLEMLLEGPTQASWAPIGNLVVAEDSSPSLDDNIIRTAQALDRWDLPRKVYEEGIKAAALDHWTKLLVRFRYGKALRKSPRLQDAGLKVWETALEQEVPERRDAYQSYALKLLVPRLMPIYMERALAEANNNQASMSSPIFGLTFSGKIIRLYERFQSLDLLKTRDLRNGLHFSRYYIRIRKNELAKALIRDLLKQSLEMMFNNDPTDDYACYWQLQMIFTTFEDDENALAAWNMMAISKKDRYDKYFKKLGRWRKKVDRWEVAKSSKISEKSEGANLLAEYSPGEESLTEIEGSDEESVRPVEPSVGFGVYCDGCHYKWKYPSVIYSCADDCGKVLFDQSCYDKLKAGTLGNDICDKNHIFLKVPEQDMRKGLNVEKGLVRVGMKVIELKKWKEKIEQRYLDHGEKK